MRKIMRMTDTGTIAVLPFMEESALARAAHESWSRLSVPDRLRPVAAFRRLLVRDALSLCEAVSRDIGKPSDETIAGELLPLAEAARFLERAAPSLLRAKRVPSSYRPLWLRGQVDYVHRRPRGIVGIIG